MPARLEAENSREKDFAKVLLHVKQGLVNYKCKNKERSLGKAHDQIETKAGTPNRLFIK